MSIAGADAMLSQDIPSPNAGIAGDTSEQFVRKHERFAGSIALSKARNEPRRTPRKSLIVVLPENHVVSPDLISNRLATGDNELVDVILACAGQPLGISALRRTVRDLQILVAPAGTSSEDLRELGMSQAPGDIVTLLSGIPARA
jgi:hypothetical protein